MVLMTGGEVGMTERENVIRRIEREDAIRRIKTVLQLTHTKSLTVTIPRYTAELVVSMLEEQKAENGEWITIWREDDPDTSTHARCSICNRISERPLGGYCKWCGAKMSQEWGVDG